MQDAIGQSEEFLEFQERVSRAAKVNRPIIIQGERGTGKELAAHRLHFLSSRWQGPFMSLNCAALTPTLIDAELFGYERGAFTGADRQRPGRFEAATGGTLFLDEIALIPMEVQEKILGVVEYGNFVRVGGTKSIETDVRIIAAANTNLLELAEQGKFKHDLLDRFSFDVLFAPPLRERKDDIMLLANQFAAAMTQELGRTDIPEFSQDAEDALLCHTWPGNIRELKNTIERAVYRSDSSLVSEIIFNPFKHPYSTSMDSGADETVPQKIEQPEPEEKNTQQRSTINAAPPALLTLSLKEAVKDLEIKMISAALNNAKHNRKKAAEELGLTYGQLRGLTRKYKNALGE